MALLLLAVAVVLAGGLLAFALSRAPALGTAVAVSAIVAGCLLGLVPAVGALAGGPPSAARLDWDGPHGSVVFEVDALSAFFLLPTLALSALAAVYGGSYLAGARGRKPVGAHWLAFAAFVAGMVLVLVARTGIVFLVAWELMSLAAFVLICFDHERREVRRAGWVYLIATHLGVAFLLALFALLGRHAGGASSRTSSGSGRRPRRLPACCSCSRSSGSGPRPGWSRFTSGCRRPTPPPRRMCPASCPG